MAYDERTGVVLAVEDVWGPTSNMTAEQLDRRQRIAEALCTLGSHELTEAFMASWDAAGHQPNLLADPLALLHQEVEASGQ